MTDDLTTFRNEARAWLEANCPPEMKKPWRSDDDYVWGGRKAVYRPGEKEWLDRIAAKGWTVPDWPIEYGGAGLSPEMTKVLRNELADLDYRIPLLSMGIWMLGPALLKYGSEEQKRQYLPPIARGEIRWCQGYSEPGAGSDLAGLVTKAEDRGDHFLVNGQKVWTTYGDKADWIFCLVRTDPANKHKGISFVLFPMDSPGVTVRPIRLISGVSPFCELFFEDVLVPKANIVGELNKGWDVAKYLLNHEREMISDMGTVFGTRESLPEMALDRFGRDAAGRLCHPMLRSRIAAFQARDVAFEAMVELFTAEMKAGSVNPAQSSMMKYFGSELNKAKHELIVSIHGSDAMEWSGPRSGEGAIPQAWLRTKGNSIEGGTSEIQLNIIAKRILNLPGA